MRHEDLEPTAPAEHTSGWRLTGWRPAVSPIVIGTLAWMTWPLVVSAGVLTGFTETTNEAGIDVVYSTSGYSLANYTGGGAVGDFNRDGWQDLFVIGGGDDALPDRLYLNNGDGTFIDRGADWGLLAHRGKGAAVGDYNGDGRLDLYVTSAGPLGELGPCHHKLYRNQGDSFAEVAAPVGVACTAPVSSDGFGAAFGDVDLDGDLDLFVAGFAADNAGSRLFRNNGDATFTDVTDDIALFGQTPISLACFAPRFADMDGDRYPELLLAADFGTSRYFRNNRDGTFSDITDAAGTGLDENGMGQAVGDVNGDGLLDWYVTSIYWPKYGYTGNKLYLNQGAHTYVETALEAGVDEGGYGWGAIAIDFDHDRRLDLAATNGTSVDPFEEEQTYLWRNNGNQSFIEMAIQAGLVHTGNGRGMVNLDYDNDGDQDIVIFAFGGAVRLYRNDLQGPSARWLRVVLDSGRKPGLAPDGYGSKVTVSYQGQTQTRWIVGGDNFLSQSELSAHFGLGNWPLVEQLRVEWPDATVTVFENVAVNQTLTVALDASLFIDGFESGDISAW